MQECGAEKMEGVSNTIKVISRIRAWHPSKVLLVFYTYPVHLCVPCLDHEDSRHFWPVTKILCILLSRSWLKRPDISSAMCMLQASYGDDADCGGAGKLYWRPGILPVGQEFRVTRRFSMYTWRGTLGTLVAKAS